MEPFVKVQGIVAPLPRANVDTDQIIPKQFLKRIERTGFGEFLFFDWRYLDDGKTPNPEFELNHPGYHSAKILITERNFGCGSSREHAPWALSQYGFRSIIAPSFADIFYNNCFKNGMLPVVLPEKTVEELIRRAEESPGYSLTVDLEVKKVYDQHGWEMSFEVDESRRERLLKGLDDIGISLRYESDITAFEARRPAFLDRQIAQHH
ncbi:MAG: 3-isopropylmalate dehydratase small subunit [Armatimonadetes bacterium]|nr:3-isopropylmalate dehydratase small subunit [Armatimonadota bacterium]